MQKYRVSVQRPEFDEDNLPYWRGAIEVHRADSWQSAILSHSLVGAEFENLIDDDDLEQRCDKYWYNINWEFA